MSHYVVGLTGGIGSGKSTVADMFVAQGAELVDTDQIAHELTGPGGAAMPALIAAFGAASVDASGALNRNYIRQMVFSDKAAKLRLERILHPRIRELAAERCLASPAPYVMLAVPLLVESGAYSERCDRILVVDCPESLQIERVMARNGLSEAEVKAIMQTQASRQQRLDAAHDVVVNDADKTKLYAQVEVLHLKYVEFSAEKLKASC